MTYPGLITPTQARAQVLGNLAPASDTDAWDWVCRNLQLGDGRFDPARGGLMRHWYRIASARISGTELPGDPMAHLCEALWLIAPGQIAKTTTLLALLAWAIAEHPQPIALYGTREKDLRRLRRRALLPIIERTQKLARLLPTSQEARDRALGTDLLQVGSALLYLLIGNLIDDVRGIPVPLILLEEFDQLLADLAGQGDVIELIRVRQRTMPHSRLIVGGTTPSRVHHHGWRQLCNGSHERPMVVCPACGGLDFLNDTQVIGSGDHSLAEYPPAVIIAERLARWACRHCGTPHNATAVRAMVRDCIDHDRWMPGHWATSDDHPAGHWQPNNGQLDSKHRLIEIIPPETIERSGWANVLYSRDVTLDSFAAGMVKNLHHGTMAQGISWTNTEATRPFIQKFAPASADDIRDKAGANYAHGCCPVDDIEWLLLTWDQQGNHAGKFWYAGVLRAWRLGGESWQVWAGKAANDAERDEIEERLFPIGGTMRQADLVIKDCANPNYRQYGYLWAAAEPQRRICFRGDVRLKPGETWAEVPAPDPRKRQRTSRPPEVHEWRIHPHHWRSELQAFMQQTEGRPAWHLPADPPDFYLRSLNAEECVTELRRVVGGGMEEMVVWKPRVTTATNESVSVRKDLHWADAEKMQLAAASIFGWLDALPDPQPSAEPGPAAQPASRPEQATPDLDFDAGAAGHPEGVW